MKERLDVLLVQMGYFKTREKAKASIMAGVVIVNDKKIEKAGTQIKVTDDLEIRIKGEILPYVSRGGFKLEKAIETFEMDLSKKVVLDVGASTGGFTDCALINGASKVYAVDVGKNQLDYKLRTDDRVISYEGMHIKNLTLEEVPKVDYIVMDVSFISLTKVLEHLVKFMKEETKIMALIKPQFEVGKENISKGGIVKGEKLHKIAILGVENSANENGLFLEKISYSPIRGGKGNIEYISLFSKGKINNNLIDLDDIIKKSQELGK